MNCKDVFAALETGGFAARFNARRHLGRCGRCAAAYAALSEAKQRLAQGEPLSSRVRARWERAADDSISDRQRLRPWIALTAGVAAACLLLVVLRMKMPISVVPVPPTHQSPETSPIVVEDVDAAAEFARLAVETSRLQEQIHRLRDQASRREAQREVAIALDRFRRW